MKTGKTLKLAGALAASLALLVMLAGCGQSSKPSPRSETSSGTPAKNTSQTSPSTQASSPPASSSSSSTPGSSFASSASTGSSASTASSAPAASASSSAPSSTTESRPSNEVLYLLAYIKYRGGLEAITPSDLIVDKYMIGTQKGTVLPDTIPKQVSLQMAVDGKEVKVMGPPPPPTPESSPNYSLKAVYNANSLVNEYYSTLAQQAEVNSLLQEGERHNVLDVLALLKCQSITPTTSDEQSAIENAYLNGTNNLWLGAGVNLLILINGKEITLLKSISSQIGDPVYNYYYHFNTQALIKEYYSTPDQRAQINKDISQGTVGYTLSSILN